MPSDTVFVQWLLSAINNDGDTVMSRDEHVQKGKALKEQGFIRGFLFFAFADVVLFYVWRGCVEWLKFI